MPTWLPILLALALPAADEPVTVAERTGFEATSSYAETLDFLRALERASPEIRLDSFGVSAEGRPLSVVVAARGGALTPDAAERAGRAVVLIQCGIHGGEIDGKDAALPILRDLAFGRHRTILDGIVLLVVPIYNVDGHERVSPHNRPNQNGPVRGMGFRTTADGHDLNRDHLKLDTPEARALIGLVNRWRPHLHVDNHVTDGVEHDWVLTYSWVEAPQLAPTLDEWMRAIEPAVVAATERAGHRVGPYVELIDRTDPARGFESWVGDPRTATGYFPLRNRPSILVENHSYRPYADRVAANRDFLLALLLEVARDPAALRRAVARAEARVAEAGRPGAAPSDTVLEWAAAPADETIRWPARPWRTEESEVLGTPLVVYARDAVRELEVPWSHRSRAVRSAARPRGYLVLPGWPAIEERLRGHGLRVRRLEAAASLDVETLRLADPRPESPSAPSYQGRTRLAFEVARRVERRELPAGTLWIGADQPDFEVAVQLLEPEAPDSLVRWGVLSTVLERKEYIEPRVLEQLARAMLADPAVRAAWEAELESPEFAADPRARMSWWHRRTPHWDETYGLLPVFRRMQPLDVATVAW